MINLIIGFSVLGLGWYLDKGLGVGQDGSLYFILGGVSVFFLTKAKKELA